MIERPMRNLKAKETNIRAFLNYLDELHAKLVYAEALLIRALLTFIQDQGLFSFISGALKIKECHDLFS